MTKINGILYLLCFLILNALDVHGEEREEVYIKIEGFSKAKAPFAIVPFQPKEGTTPHVAHPNLSKIDAVIANDLQLTGWVKILNPKSFIGDPQEGGMDERKIVFKNWRAIGAIYLIKGSYEYDGTTLKV